MWHLKKSQYSETNIWVFQGILESAADLNIILEKNFSGII